MKNVTINAFINLDAHSEDVKNEVCQLIDAINEVLHNYGGDSTGNAQVFSDFEIMENTEDWLDEEE